MARRGETDPLLAITASTHATLAQKAQLSFTAPPRASIPLWIPRNPSEACCTDPGIRDRALQEPSQHTQDGNIYMTLRAWRL